MPAPVYGDWSGIWRKRLRASSRAPMKTPICICSDPNRLPHPAGPIMPASPRLIMNWAACSARSGKTICSGTPGSFSPRIMGKCWGDHHMSQKNLFFEGSAHIPLFIVPPAGRGIPHNLTVDRPTEIADIYPTILKWPAFPSGRHHRPEPAEAGCACRGSDILRRQPSYEFLRDAQSGQACIYHLRRPYASVPPEGRSDGTDRSVRKILHGRIKSRSSSPFCWNT